MPYLSVPGAELYYETTGTGPLILTISGANGSADIWRPLAAQLSTTFTVCIYHRRGFTRSYLSGSQDYSQRLETDADDAAALIKHTSRDGRATVLGNSSGAIVSLMLLTRHPDVLHTLIPHEPPSFPLLPPNIHNKITADMREVYDTYRQHGPIPALDKFAAAAKMDSPAEKAGLMKAFDPRGSPHIAGNTMYWFERELCIYTSHVFDVEELQRLKGKLVLANGNGSNKEARHRMTNMYLAEMIGVGVEDWTGMHLGFASHPEEFAMDFTGLLKRRNYS